MSARKLRVILNGGRASPARIADALARVRRHGHIVDVSVTSRATGAEALARDALDEKADIIVAAGGDGTLNEVVNGLFAASGEPDVAMAVLPLGSANDFARSGAIPSGDPGAALMLAAEAEPTPIDVGRVNGRYFLNTLVAGLGAEASFRASEAMKRRFRGAAYTLAGIATAARRATYPVRLRTRDGAAEHPLAMLAIANGKWAGGTRIAPRASLDDGLLDLLLVPEISLLKLPALLSDFRALDRSRGDPKFVRYEQHEWLEIEALGRLPTSPDGERICGTDLRISVLPRRLPFILAGSAATRR